LAQQPSAEVLAEARARFGRGVAHTQAREWEEAVTEFRAALELHAAPTIRYNLAAALVELHQFREADHELSQVLADSETPANIMELARTLDRRITNQAGHLTVTLAAEAQDAEVQVDGEVVEHDTLDDLVVSPGSHTVALLRDGTTMSEAEVAVRAGETSRVRLGMAGAVTSPPVVQPPPREPDHPPPTSVPIYEEWGFWLGVGVGVAAIAAAIALIVVFVPNNSDAADVVPGNFMPGVITW
jgi:hypothetical protein